MRAGGRGSSLVDTLKGSAADERVVVRHGNKIGDVKPSWAGRPPCADGRAGAPADNGQCFGSGRWKREMRGGPLGRGEERETLEETKAHGRIGVTPPGGNTRRHQRTLAWSNAPRSGSNGSPNDLTAWGQRPLKRGTAAREGKPSEGRGTPRVPVG